LPFCSQVDPATAGDEVGAKGDDPGAKAEADEAATAGEMIAGGAALGIVSTCNI
jgi:hypothetical protein